MIIFLSPLRYHSSFFLYSPIILLEKIVELSITVVIKYIISEPKSGKTQDIKLNFIKKFKAWWDFILSGSIPPCTLLCSSFHLVVVQVFICFNRHHRALYQFHWQWCAIGAVPVKWFVVSATLKFTPDNT